MASAAFRKFFLRCSLAALSVALASCAPHDDSSVVPGRSQASITLKSRPISAQFESLAENAVAGGKVAGVQFAIVEGGDVLATKGFGLADREMNVPMTVDTPINVASISKPVTAWGVLALAERNNLDLDASVRNLLGDADLYDEIFPGIDVSLRMLLSHTSGLSGPSVPVTPATETLPELADILRGNSSVARPKIERPPGSGFSYSGAGYLVLQMIIENQSQQEFARFMTDVVLAHAGMPDSTYVFVPGMLDRVAVYYRGDGRRREPYHLAGAAGGLYSTANDMARFIMTYTGNGSAARKQIISGEAYGTLLDPVADSVEYGNQDIKIQYALGHYRYKTEQGIEIAFHAGGNPGLRSFFIVAMERDIGFFAVVNSDHGTEVLTEMLSAWGNHYGLTLHAYH